VGSFFRCRGHRLVARRKEDTVIDRTELKNAFEFVAVASARARQLLRGCTSRVEAPERFEKKVKLAQHEVRTGAVRKVVEE
jgi:DNA-directed RNA polymerase subunit K/omega